MSSENTTIARPYAKALFSLAQTEKAIGQWEQLLINGALISAQADIQRWLNDPGVSPEEKADLFIAVCKPFSDVGETFFKLMAENRRLALLPHIADLYIAARRQYEQMSQVEVISTSELEADHKNALQKALSQKLGMDVTLTCRIDSALLGGIQVKAGDKVIDGSVKNQIQKLKLHLMG